MSINGPILIVDDDIDDQDLIATAIRQVNMKNEIKQFLNGQELLEYLQNTNDQPFIILCDIKMPIMNGLELRRQINADAFLRKKSIPFVFFAATVSRSIIDEAYELTVQGFFEKGKTYQELQDTIVHVINYWKHALHPNRF